MKINILSNTLVGEILSYLVQMDLKIEQSRFLPGLRCGIIPILHGNVILCPIKFKILTK